MTTTLAVRDQQLMDARAKLDHQDRIHQEDQAEIRRKVARAAYYHGLYIAAVPEGQRLTLYSERAGRLDAPTDRMGPPPPPAAPA